MTRIGDRSSGFDEGVIGTVIFGYEYQTSSKQAYMAASCRRVGLLCLAPFFLCLPLFMLQSDLSVIGCSSFGNSASARGSAHTRRSLSVDGVLNCFENMPPCLHSLILLQSKQWKRL
jgi:hypothetical protein